MPVDERVARSVALEQAYVHDVYEQFYDNPKSKPWPKVQRFLDELEPGSLVCDVGCGNGKYLNVNTSIFNIGGEKSTRLSEVAREKENEVVTLDNLALPFRDESLDAVVSIAVVHHLATTDRRICALRELARVLRIGGRLIISVWAMEQSHRKFESQDVLVPWHRPRHLSTRPSLELTSTTTNTSEDDGTLPPYHAYTQTSDSDSNRSIRSKGLGKKKGRNRHKGKSIDPRRSSSPSSSSLSSPNETCYSFVRRAIQKLAGGGRRVGVHRPWFLDSWSTCAKEPPPPQKRYDPDGCECCDCCSSIEENVQDLPIELRRIDDEDLPQRRQTFPSSQLINDISNNLKSKSMTNIKTVENNNNIENNKASVDSNEHVEVIEESKSDDVPSAKNTLIRPKPKLVKQKKSICDNAEEEEAEEALDQPTDMTERNLPEFKILHNRYHHRGGVLKQRSLNEELMSTDRLKEKERVRQNIQKQASLNEDLFYQSRHHAAFDTFKDSFFSVSTSKRFQLIKTGFTNKIKNSTTNIEKVTGTSLKNGFVRMFQNWKSSDLISPSIPEDETMENMKKIVVSASTMEEKKDGTTAERRHSKEDGSDSSKDSSLQSDTSVDSEDSFASVIFVPKSDPMSPTSNLSPGPTSPRLKNSSVPNSPRIKQSSCPTSPRIKQMPLTLYPLTKQLSSPKPSTDESAADKSSDRDHMDNSTINKDINTTIKTLAQKYSVQQIPQFRRTSLNSPPPGNNTTTTTTTTTITTMTTTTTTNNNNAIVSNVVSPEKSPVESRNERLKKIKELLSQKPGFGVRNSKSNFPIVRQSSVTNGGKVEAIAKPLPKLLTLELFNPETDDKDSDSSCVSSPDSIDSVININNEPCCKTKFKFPPTNNHQHHRRPSENNKSMSLLEAAADVANSLDEAVEHVIKSTSPRRRAKRKLQTGEVLSVIQRYYSDTQPLLNDDDAAAAVHSCWNEECHRYLTDFADKLSEKLLQEIDNYQEKSKGRALMSNSLDDYDDDNNSSSIDDPYIHRLSEELNDLSKLSAEIQKQNEYLAKLSASDNLYIKMCSKCKMNECKCYRTKSKINISPNNNNNRKVIGDDGAETTNINPNSKLNSSNNKSAITNDLFSNNLDSEQCDIKCLDNNIDDNIDMIGSVTKTAKMIKLGTSTDSYDSEKESSTNSILSSVATSINFGQSMESTDGNSESQKDTNSISRYSDGGGSTASLVSSSNCPPEWKTPKTKSDSHQQLTKDASCLSLESTYSSTTTTTNNKRLRERSLISETSQDSLPSDNIGGEITYHRYYHVFREGELDQLIEKYVENLHIISSYYDHASWCIIAEKVQVWTI